MVGLHKVAVAAIVLVETIVFCYAPKITERFSIYRNNWINEKTLNNATSGALLSLAFTHLLPEGFGHAGCDLVVKHVDFRGFIMGMPILLLVTIDFFAGHHCGTHSVVQSGVKSLNNSSIPNLDVDVELMHLSHTHKALSHVSTDHDYKNEGHWGHVESISLRLKQLFTSRALYLLLTFYAHSVLEGALLGAQKTAGSLWGMAFGICAHKWAECLVLNTTATNLITWGALRHACSIAFALCIPLGILIGSQIEGKSETTQVVFQLLAIGFFLYLSFELLTHQVSEDESHMRWPLWTSYFLGAVVMAAILVVVEMVEHGEGNGHGDQESHGCPANGKK
ncbi:membrane protein, putative [Babesia bigemina]|uniref:Membrane protein, putative n=1 Tax=Babesia bigemina TaxID=5866 RepID=A0A061DEZ0_BABBI|nr:membrane protein, putative [Babesia bigemina]CDR98115.1 membrane protein, putative [Babesia bigemina]|eukprot:XP_012770301.1 membrane protein, putative [Babesia bigemina]